MLKNKNKRKVKTKVPQPLEDILLLKKLPGLLALCEFVLILFLVTYPSRFTGITPESAREGNLSAVIPAIAGEVQIAAASKPILEPKEIIEVTVTAYSSTRDQTDDTPFHTANGNRVRDGIVAANFLPLGTKLRIPEVFGNKIFTVLDRMHDRFDRHIDIWMSTREAAKEFGIRYLKVEIL